MWAAPDGGHGPPQPGLPKSLVPSSAPVIWAPSPFSPDDGAMPATAQWTKPSASSSVTSRAISTVPAGGAVHTSSGERSSPSHVKRASIGPPGAHGSCRENAGGNRPSSTASVEHRHLSSGTPGRLDVVGGRGRHGGPLVGRRRAQLAAVARVARRRRRRRRAITRDGAGQGRHPAERTRPRRRSDGGGIVEQVTDPAAGEQRSRLTLLTVHAHPDDEASKGAPTLARYHAEGVHTVLVCCTGGEEGDLQNPTLREPGQPFHGLTPEEEKAKVVAHAPGRAGRVGRDHRLRRGRDARLPRLGHARHRANEHPDSFHQADIDEATGRLVAVIRRTRPQVIITYGDDQQGYPHPDHLKVHDISVLAFDRAGDPDWYPELGEPFQPSKLYYSTWSRARMSAVHEALHRARRRVAVRREVARAAGPGPPHHDHASTSATSCGPARRRCGPTPRRSTRRRRGGSASTTTRWPRSTRGRTGSSPARWSAPIPSDDDRATTCSPASASRSSATPMTTRPVPGRRRQEGRAGRRARRRRRRGHRAARRGRGRRLRPDGRVHAGQVEGDRAPPGALFELLASRRGGRRAQPARSTSLSSL